MRHIANISPGDRPACHGMLCGAVTGGRCARGDASTVVKFSFEQGETRSQPSVRDKTKSMSFGIVCDGEHLATNQQHNAGPAGGTVDWPGHLFV